MAHDAHAVQGTGRAFGTFGELLQGVLPESDLDFLVTLPIARYSWAVFVPDRRMAGVVVDPPHKHKAYRLATLLLEYFGLPPGGRLILRSQLPEGKGLASSSADLVATARAVAAALGREIPVNVLLELLRGIEPTDGVLYPGAVAFYHRQVRLGAFLGVLPPLTIVGTDEGGEIDTVVFNERPKPFTAAEKIEYQTLLERLTDAIRCQDGAAIGHIATGSAVMNQRLNPKRTLDQVRALSEHVGGLGTVVAHSGTYLGVLLSPTMPRYRHHLRAAYTALLRLTGNAAVYRVLTRF